MLVSARVGGLEHCIVGLDQCEAPDAKKFALGWNIG